MKYKQIIYLVIMFSFLTNIKADASDYVSIPEDAIDFNGHTYKFYIESIDWNSAKEICKSYGGHLVTITSNEENNFLLKNLPNSDKSFYWIGATDEIKEGIWTWVTGESFFYNNWSENSPNNNSNKEHYAGFMSKEENYDGYSTPLGSWNDFQLSPNEESGYICEWDFTYITPDKSNMIYQQKNMSTNTETLNDNKENTKNQRPSLINLSIETFNLFGISVFSLSIFGGIIIGALGIRIINFIINKVKELFR
jgi:hypothetical protein